MSIIEEPDRYEHEALCDPLNDLVPSGHPAILACSECLGLFDKITKKGIAIMDRRIVG